jgi:hypothetical protein
VRTQKLMWCNIMKSTKSKKVSILHYNIDKFYMKLGFEEKHCCIINLHLSGTNKIKIIMFLL